MEPEISLPSSQEPTIGPYPEPDESIHTSPPSISNIHSVIFPSMLSTYFHCVISCACGLYLIYSLLSFKSVDHSEDLGTYGKIILEWFLWK
jgi:hypothetical protein